MNVWLNNSWGEVIWDAKAAWEMNLRINSAPKIRQILWCDFSEHSILPEFGKTRPVIIMSFKHVLKGHCCVLPISTDDQTGLSEIWGHPLSVQLTAGRRSWVVCNHPYTISNERLSPFDDNTPRLDEQEFNQILEKLLAWLPKLP